MKYVLFAVGVVVGLIIAPLFTDSSLLQWIVRLGLGIVGYNIPAFVRYNKASPKQLLAFHGENAPLSRSKSANEIATFLSQLEKGGLIQGINKGMNAVAVYKEKWNELNASEQIAFSQIAAQYFNLIEESASVSVVSTQMEMLASYSLNEGYIGKNSDK